MQRKLDLADIQGNLLNAYGRQGFPKARYLVFNVRNARAGRAFVEALRPRITTAVRWPSRRHIDAPVKQEKPKVAINIAFSFLGLHALELPTRTLRGFPDEFIDGMIKRAPIIGDSFPANALDRWDAVWQGGAPDRTVHILVTLNAQMTPDGKPVPELDQVTHWILGLCESSEGGVAALSGHRGPEPIYQPASAVLAEQADGSYVPTPKEHFGFTDGIGDPVFIGQFAPDEEKVRVIGQGKLTAAQTWEPLATGEFLLGYPDEAQEVPGAAMPLEFSRNGTFMVYRKLHENVAAFNGYLAGMAERYAATMAVPLPEALETLKAKIAGRWSNGVPLIVAPTYAAWLAWQQRFAEAQKTGDQKTLAELTASLTNFIYGKDLAGTACPVTAHMRRVNTRDSLDPTIATPNAARNGSVLNNRRRMLRRGLPYGQYPDGDLGDAGEHGVIMLTVCASIFRQFEFVQQQWLHYGLDFNAGNETCPLLGNHGERAKFVIAADPASGKPPFVCDRLPQFVETRGGEYFFMPSLTALRMIGMGIVDPT